MSLSVSRSSGNLVADRRFAWGAAAASDGDHAAAADLFAQTLEIAPAFAAAAFALGTARAAMNDTAGAGQAFEQALALDPADEQGAAQQLARLGLRPAPQTAPQAWVRALFDAYAPGFDAHLSGALRYRAPQVLAALVGAAQQARARPPVDAGADRVKCNMNTPAGIEGFAAESGQTFQKLAPHLTRSAPASTRPQIRRFAAVLDLGCGTGLSGEAFRSNCDQLAGVDLSPRMVEAARRKKIYDRLVVADIAEFLADEKPASAGLILAADVFVYIGDLATILQRAAIVLEPQGLLAFTLQKGEQAFSLGEDMRYAHSLAYIAGLAEASGLVVVQSQEVSTRRDKGANVPGFGIVLAKPA